MRKKGSGHIPANARIPAPHRNEGRVKDPEFGVWGARFAPEGSLLPRGMARVPRIRGCNRPSADGSEGAAVGREQDSLGVNRCCEQGDLGLLVALSSRFSEGC